MDPTHKVPYYFNTVTHQSQWTFPTAAAAMPLPPMPLPEKPRAASPGTLARTGAELGGVGDMAALIGLSPSGNALPKPVPKPSPLSKQGSSADPDWL